MDPDLGSDLLNDQVDYGTTSSCPGALGCDNWLTTRVTTSGDFVNHDFAEYHIATNANVGTIDVLWIDEQDPHVNPMGTKGIGEIGIVGAAAIANAAYHATGVRVRDLPITLDKLLR